MAAAVAIRDAGLRPPVALYVVSPWVDLTPPAPSYVARAELDPVVTLDSLHRMGAGYAGGLDRTDPRVSPLFADLSGLPPLFIHVGTDEILYEDGLRLSHAARRAGVHVRLEVGERMIHVWPLFHEVLRAGREAIAEAGAWLSERFQDDVSSPERPSAGEDAA
jgi:acetyl esterase/lipase